MGFINYMAPTTYLVLCSEISTLRISNKYGSVTVGVNEFWSGDRV
jgi:hypothetical protein